MPDSPHKRRKFLQTSTKVAGAFVLTSLLPPQLLANTPKTHTKGATMNTLTPNASKNLERLFGTSTLPKEDREFFTNYANFAFDEVWAHSKLGESERLLIILASLSAIPAHAEFETMLKAALNAKISPVAIKEVIYQATPYAGMGKIADILRITNKVFTQAGIKLPLEPQGTTTRDNRRQKGFETQKILFGEAIERSYANTPKHRKHINEFLSGNCFGDYYTRTGLELQFRELLTFVYIASMGGAEPQLKGHIAGNVRMGNDKAKLIATITALVPYIGYPRSLNALNAIDEVIKE